MTGKLVAYISYISCTFIIYIYIYIYAFYAYIVPLHIIVRNFLNERCHRLRYLEYFGTSGQRMLQDSVIPAGIDCPESFNILLKRTVYLTHGYTINMRGFIISLHGISQNLVFIDSQLQTLLTTCEVSFFPAKRFWKLSPDLSVFEGNNIFFGRKVGPNQYFCNFGISQFHRFKIFTLLGTFCISWTSWGS